MRPLELTAEEIHIRLCRGEPVDGLAKLPVDAILERLQMRFLQFDPADSIHDIQLEDGNIK